MGEIEKFFQDKGFPALRMISILAICAMMASLPALADDKGRQQGLKIVVGGDYNYPPYEFIDETGEPAGYSVELTRAIAEVMGFDVEIRLRPWSETRRALEAGDIDAVEGMFYSKERETHFDFSNPHAVVYHAIFARKSSPPIESLEGLRGKNVIVMRGDIVHDYLSEIGLYGNLTLVETQADALRLLASGKHDYALIAKLPAFHWMNELKLSNLVTVGPPILPSKYCYAVKAGDAEVLALFSEGLAMLHESERDKEIYDKWLGPLEPRGVPRSLIVKAAALILIPLILLLTGSWFWSWRLKSQVDRRTKDLTREIAERERAEAALQAAHGELELRVTERTAELVRANTQLGQEIEVRKRGEQELQRVNRALRVLGASNQAMVQSIDETSFLDEICRIIVEVGGYRLAWVGFAEQDEERRVRPVAQAGHEEGYLDTVEITWADTPRGRGPTGAAIRSGRPCVSRNILSDPDYEPWRAEALKRGYNSSIALPLSDEKRCFGVINIYAMEAAAFDDEEVNLLVDLASDISFGVKSLRASADGKKAEEQVWRAKGLLLRVVDGISEPLVMLDNNLRVRMLNEAALKYYQLASYQDAIGKPCYVVFKGMDSNCDDCYVSAVMSDGEKITLNRNGLFDPSRFELVTVYPLKEKAGEISGCILRISDTTEQRDVESQLARADRLSSLGQLSGGIAHEIRNPLSGISLFVDVLCDEDRFERTETELEVFQDIKNNINRIDGIIKRVLDFSRKSDVPAQAIDVNQLIRENLKLWSAKIREAEIELKLSLERDLPAVFGDAIEIQQVVHNLIQNAVESMSKGGLLGIATRKRVSSFHAGRPVLTIQLQDTGVGIDPKMQEKIFNPFFTTKPSGTGLGLSISHQIIGRHGGVITFISEPGHGTTFTIELPAA